MNLIEYSVGGEERPQEVHVEYTLRLFSSIFIWREHLDSRVKITCTVQEAKIIENPVHADETKQGTIVDWKHNALVFQVH